MKRPELTPANFATLVFTIIYMAIFTIVAVRTANHEFLYYIALMAVLVTIVVFYHRELHLGQAVLVALSLVGFLHVMGGNLYVDGTRLYSVRFFGGPLAYDNIVHFVGIFVITIALYSTTAPHLAETLHHRHILVSVPVVLMAMGIGALIEVIEFGAVVYLGAGERVGDYWNNALDLVFNLAGAVTAVGVLGLPVLRRLVRGTRNVPLGDPNWYRTTRSRRPTLGRETFEQSGDTDPGSRPTRTG